jgi:DNA-binding CsgD family transcriptional regulator
LPSLSDLLLRTADGIFAVDARQRITLWDAGCEQLFCVPRQQAIGRPCSEVVRGKDHFQQPFCGIGCSAATFAENPDIPGAFTLLVHNAQGRDLRLAVSLMLVPAVRVDQRLCIHVVRHGEQVGSVRAMQGDSSPPSSKCPAGRRMPRAFGNSFGLTAREREVLKLLVEGLPVRAVSRLLKISVVTVRNHIHHIEAKFGVHSQAEVVAYAYRHHFVSF